jgi:hypothetical protein
MIDTTTAHAIARDWYDGKSPALLAFIQQGTASEDTITEVMSLRQQAVHYENGRAIAALAAYDPHNERVLSDLIEYLEARRTAG